jgi:hypothetical protein
MRTRAKVFIMHIPHAYSNECKDSMVSIFTCHIRAYVPILRSLMAIIMYLFTEGHRQEPFATGR